MTDRIRVLTVFLDADYRDDDAAPIITAIHMVKGVQSVQTQVVTLPDRMARIAAKNELRREVADAIVAVLQDDKP